MELKFPKTCFISHSYKDEEAYGLLMKKLQNRGVQPYVFPPIKVSPRNFSSNTLIEAILEHQSLIYIKGGHSDQSFWVAFERDYALRAHKQVDYFDPMTYKIEKSRIAPLQLPIYPSYFNNDKERLQDLFKFMQNRHIDFYSWSNTIPNSGMDTMTNSVSTVVRNGGYYVLFLSSKALKSKNVKLELGYSLKSYPDKILIGLIDEVNKKDIPNFSENLHIVQLYGDKKRSEKHRWDDLIVNLYWLILKNSHSVYS